MESSSKPQENRNPPQLSSQTSYCTSSNSVNGAHQTISTTRPITRTEITPYPTTFVQADTSSFKQVVQMLTGSSDTAKNAAAKPPSSAADMNPIRAGPKKSQSGFKLYERRSSLKGLQISPLIPGLVQNSGSSPRMPEILSPSMLDFPSLALSPVTPLIPDPFNRSPQPHPQKSDPVLDSRAEERAIAEKGFFLHPSPATTPRDLAEPPQLLPLFPLTSPRASGAAEQ